MPSPTTFATPQTEAVVAEAPPAPTSPTWAAATAAACPSAPAPACAPSARRAWVRRLGARRLDALRRAARGDAGDVPGWVLVTLMTAGLVLAIWAVAGPALTNLFATAIARVTTFGG